MKTIRDTVIIVGLLFLGWQLGGDNRATPEASEDAVRHSHDLVTLAGSLCHDRIEAKLAPGNDIAYVLGPRGRAMRGRANPDDETAVVDIFFTTHNSQDGLRTFKARCRYDDGRITSVKIQKRDAGNGGQ